jgi:hypothetical protein
MGQVQTLAFQLPSESVEHLQVVAIGGGRGGEHKGGTGDGLDGLQSQCRSDVLPLAWLGKCRPHIFAVYTVHPWGLRIPATPLLPWS